MSMPNSDRFSCHVDCASLLCAISRDTPEHISQALHVNEISSWRLGLLLQSPASKIFHSFSTLITAVGCRDA